MASLRRRQEIDEVCEAGSRQVGGHAILLVAAGEPGWLRVAFKMSRRRWNAVTRNRIRRRFKEALRALLPHVDAGGGVDVVIIPRGPAESAPFLGLVEELRLGLEALGRSR